MTEPRWGEPLDEQAFEDFARRHGASPFEPVTVVIPAYQEASNIGAVLDKIPPTLGGHRVTVVVVVDGGDDGTEDVVTGSGHLVCYCPVNRGQGAALRLGYRLAAARNTRFLVTLDADGQWDPADLETVLHPVLDGNADLVNGSRRMGEVPLGEGDRMRELGVVVFATLITILTGHRVTDPANGIRAMVVSLPEALALEEDQYQSSELLIGAIMRGYRVTEQPVAMRTRSSGSSKKGTNLRYGLQFARVVLKTWWRER